MRLGFCSKKYIKTEENEVHNKITGKIFLPSGRCGFSEIDFLVRKIANPPKKKEAEDLAIAKGRLQSLRGELQQDPLLLGEFQRLQALHSAKQADLAARAPEQSPVPGEPSRRSSRIRKPKPIHDV